MEKKNNNFEALKSTKFSHYIVFLFKIWYIIQFLQ